MNLPRSIYQFSILVMDIFCGIVLRFLASVVDHIENLVKLFVDSNPYKWPHDEPIRVHTVYTKLFSSDGIIVSTRCGNKMYYQGVVPRCGTEVWYGAMVLTEPQELSFHCGGQTVVLQFSSCCAGLSSARQCLFSTLTGSLILLWTLTQ